METPGAGRLRRVAPIGAMLFLVLSRAALAAEWRLFGVDSLSGYLAWKSEGYAEQSGAAVTQRQILEQQGRLILASYIFHPRFLSLTADTTLALRSGTEGDSGLRNLDSGVGLDFFRGHPLSFGVSGRSKVEDLERDFKDYQRQTVGGAGRLALSTSRLAASLKYETSEARSEGYFPEDKLSRYLFADSSLRLASSDTLSLRYQMVGVDDRLSSEDSLYHSAEVNGGHEFLDKRGKVNVSVSSWQAQLPLEEQRVTVRESWHMTWSPTLRTTEEAELTRRAQAGSDFNTYRAGVDVSRDVSQAWSLSGNLAALRNFSSSGDSAVYRLAGGAAYRGEWRHFRVRAENLLSLTQSLAGPRKEVRVYDEAHSLPLNPVSSEPLNNSYIDAATIKVKDRDNPANDWTRFVRIIPDGVYTRILWDPDAADLLDPGYPADKVTGQSLAVLVDYVYVLPESNYAELGDLLNLQLLREYAPGVGIESNLNVTTTVPGTSGAGLAGLNFGAARYDLGLQGFLKRPTYEVGAGAGASRDRQTLFVRGSAVWQEWSLSESCRAEFFPDLVGHAFDTKVSRLWGINEKTHLNVELADQAYSASGSLNRGLTSVRLRTVRLFNPFMRVEVEGRGELNRALANDTKFALDARYLWQQGQLDLTAGYEFKLRTYDRFTSHRLYATLIRKF